MARESGYYLPESGRIKLEALVDQIEANPGDFIDLKEVRDYPERLDVRKVVESLPEGITEDDFVGIMKLAMLTESATDSYAAVFTEGAQTYGADWLIRFNERVWVPDEHTHYAPYKGMLQSIGFTEEELDREMRETMERQYEHCCGKTPVELTTYGTIQEYLTDHWHGLISQLLRAEAPQAAHVANLIKRRETLHTVWYRDMTAVMVEENHENLALVAKTLTTFQMPGTRLVPEYGPRSQEWLIRLNTDFTRIARELVRNFSEAAGNLRRTGMLLVEMAVARDYNIGPFPPKVVRTAMNRLGGPGYGLLGEAILERVGLPIPPEWTGTQDGATRFYSGAYEKVRSKMRSFVAAKIDVRTITGDTSST
jgi:hypothetical protein